MDKVAIHFHLCFFEELITQIHKKLFEGINVSHFLPYAGIVNLVNPVQFQNAPYPMVVRLSGNEILVRLLQPDKASRAILVTLSGIEILVILEHPAKHTASISVTPYGIVIPVRQLHSWKAHCPI